ncbi:hypothetical protein B0T16DRAFT_371138 [Cercophora newfieldiana]|uniref:Uncharacterized protein n=1 Tax=Cercophora newfieldiana TaxID=92897 RepID=A0AA40CTP1_9PEZI|nr:hypothetical protein B0T16DRAFT_371138 [Cercophora newfieldiana]
MSTAVDQLGIAAAGGPDFGNATTFTSSQELPASCTNPLKLIALLREQFGLGRYEVVMSRSVYSIHTPRRLSLDEIARCRAF